MHDGEVHQACGPTTGHRFDKSRFFAYCIDTADAVRSIKVLSRRTRLRQRILEGRSETNIRFDELRALLLRLGFVERVRGSHHIFRKEGVTERLNLQRDGSNAKPYQVRQVRQVILKYRLEEE